MDEGRLNLRLLVSLSLTLFLDGLDDDAESPLSSPIATPRASDFPRDRSTKQLAMDTSPIPEIVHDLSPMILSGRRLLRTSGSREELPPRPFSTPPRVSSRTEATRFNG
jgi:hypothetical protein